MTIKKLLASTTAGVLLFGSLATTSLAASMASNGSFEDGTVANPFTTLTPGATNITDWEVVAGSVDYIGNLWQAAEGDRSIDMTGYSAGSIRQEVPTVVGAKYQLSFAMSGNPDGGPAEKSMDVDTGGVSTNYVYNTATEGTTRADMRWSEESLVFTATAAMTPVTFTSLIAGFYGPALDNVRVEQILPTSKDDCKKGGWEYYGVFKNQGDCVSYVATEGANPPALQ